MKSALSFNIHASGVNNWGDLYAHIRRLNPAYLLIMDFDNKRALALQSAFPDTQVILRIPIHARVEASWGAMSNLDWLAWFIRHSENGKLIIQWLNEPTGYGTYADASSWAKNMEEIGILAGESGIKISGPNFGVGNPNIRFVQQGVFDKALRVWVKYGHILGLHEYALKGSLLLGNFIQRYKVWKDRALALGVDPLKIVITETGFDIGGGSGDGYRGRISTEAYAALLRQIGALYAADGVTGCIYCYGSDGGWEAFNIQQDTLLLNSISDPLVPLLDEVKAPSEYVEAQLIMPGAWVNLRETPSLKSRVVGRVFDTQTVDVKDAGDFWEVKLTTHGYVSKQNGRVALKRS